MKRNFPKTISILASPEEILQIERIKLYHHRKTTADMLRYLIAEEAKKIFATDANNVARGSAPLAK